MGGVARFFFRFSSSIILALVALPLSAQAVNVTVTWDPVSLDVNGNPETLAGYDVYWGTAPSTYTQSAFTSSIEYTLTNLIAGTQYYVAVKAQDVAGNLSAYGTIQGSTTITELTFVATNPCGNGTIDSGEQCDGSNLNGNTCSSQGFDGGSLSCSSSCMLVTSSCTYNPANAPSGLSAVAASSSQINLSFTDNASNESGFKINRCTSSSLTSDCTNFAQVATRAASTSNPTTYQNTGLSASTRYCYQVVATRNSAADSAPSNSACANTSAPPDITPPTLSGGLPSGTLAAGTTTATLRVTTNENATCKYAANSGLAFASMPSTFASTGGTSHSSNVSVQDGMTYNYYVRCQDASGNADQSDYLITFSVASPPPPNNCGNGMIDSGESCDGSNLNGKTCATLGQGFDGGTLSCSSACTFNTSACTVNQPPVVSSLVCTPDLGKAPLASTCVATASDPEGASLSYDWDFGDGVRKLAGASQEVHTFSGRGTYTVLVTVRDSKNQTQKSAVVQVVNFAVNGHRRGGQNAASSSIQVCDVEEDFVAGEAVNNGFVPLNSSLAQRVFLSVPGQSSSAASLSTCLTFNQVYRLSLAASDYSESWSFRPEQNGSITLIDGDPSTFFIDATGSQSQPQSSGMYSVTSGGCGETKNSSLIYLLLVTCALLIHRVRRLRQEN